MKIGLLFPITENIIPGQSDIDKLNQLSGKFIDSLWFRDLPVTINDEGSWVDPVAYIPYLSEKLEDKNILFGISVFNTSFRMVETILKSSLSLQYLTNNRFILGLGSGEVLEAFNLVQKEWDNRNQNLSKALKTLNSYWNLGTNRINNIHQYISIPDNFQLPPIGIASSKKEILKEKELYQEVFTHVKSSKDISELKKLIGAEKKINMLLNLKIDESVITPVYKEINKLSVLFINSIDFKNYIELYEAAGVNRIILHNPHSEELSKIIDTLKHINICFC